MREEPMVAHADANVDSYHVQHDRYYESRPGKAEQRCDRPKVKERYESKDKRVKSVADTPDLVPDPQPG